MTTPPAEIVRLLLNVTEPTSKKVPYCHCEPAPVTMTALLVAPPPPCPTVAFALVTSPPAEIVRVLFFAAFPTINEALHCHCDPAPVMTTVLLLQEARSADIRASAVRHDGAATDGKIDGAIPAGVEFRAANGPECVGAADVNVERAAGGERQLVRSRNRGR